MKLNTLTVCGYKSIKSLDDFPFRSLNVLIGANGACKSNLIRDPLPQSVELKWTERGDPDTPYRAHVLSDGTLRFLCLTTLLLQPLHLQPDTIIIDEPVRLHTWSVT